MQSRVSAVLLALTGWVVDIAAMRSTISLTKADQLQLLLGKHLSAEAAGVITALADELGQFGKASWNVSTHAAATGRNGARDADIQPHIMASRKVVQMGKAMALAQSIEKGGVEVAQTEDAQLLLENGKAQKANRDEGAASVAAAEAMQEAVQANETLMEQKDTNCGKVYNNFLEQKKRLLNQVTKVEKRQQKSSGSGKWRPPGLLTLGRIGRAFLGLTSAEEKARQADPAGSCAISAGDHKEIKEGMQKVHPCWPKVQEAARKQEESVSEEEKQEAFIRFTNVMLSCKEPSEAELETGKEAIKVHGGETEEVAKAGALEMQQEATDVAKLELELLDDEEEDEEEEDEEEDDGAEASLSLLEQGLGSHGSAAASFTTDGASSAFAAANSDLLARVQAQVEAAVGRVGQLLDSGHEKQAASLARGLLVGREDPHPIKELIPGPLTMIGLVIFGAILLILFYTMCLGTNILWFFLSWFVCIIYKALSLVVRVTKKLLQLSSDEETSGSFWGCYRGGFQLLNHGFSSACTFLP